MPKNRVKPCLGTICLIAAALLAGCENSGPATDTAAVRAAPAETIEARAERLAREILIADGHVDIPYRLYEDMEDISVRTEKGDFDYPRAKAGGLDAPFMSIYVPADLEDDGARERADELIDMVEKFEADWPDKFAVATSPAEVEAAFAAGKIALPMGMENGAPIEGDLGNLRHFAERGIRYITLTHSKNNHICDSSYETEKKWQGLSPFGREVVAEMNRLGVMVDISHVSDDTFYQVMELSQAPAIASHSSCRKFTPGFERNMDDDMIRKLAENGGVIMINYGSAFLTESANAQSFARWAAVRQFAEENGLDPDDERVQAFNDEHRAKEPTIYADLADVVAHIDHVVQLVGVDHVGLGSDFDGVGDSLPTGLKDASQIPNLLRALLEKGYSEDDLRKIGSGNLMRVWRQVDEVAARLQAG
ncbi:MAG: membrane dipeptidase [bacterium]|nr:membrane dipeptidase [bacterium]